MYMNVDLKWFYMYKILCAKNYNLWRPVSLLWLKCLLMIILTQQVSEFIWTYAFPLVLIGHKHSLENKGINNEEKRLQAWKYIKLHLVCYLNSKHRFHKHLEAIAAVTPLFLAHKCCYFKEFFIPNTCRKYCWKGNYIAWTSSFLNRVWPFPKNIVLSGWEILMENLIKVGLITFHFNESSLKMMKNVFYFILKVLFILKIFKFLSWYFVHVEEMA